MQSVKIEINNFDKRATHTHVDLVRLEIKINSVYVTLIRDLSLKTFTQSHLLPFASASKFFI